MTGNKSFLLWILFAIAFVVAIFVWNAYVKTQDELSLTQDALKETQLSLSNLESSTTEAIAEEMSLINSQTKALVQSQSNQATLTKTVTSLQNSQTTTKSVTAVNNVAPSIVKIVCRLDSTGDLSQGSGVLYHSTSVTSPYFIQTNLHVVKPSDSSSSSCVIAIYPNNSDPSKYLVFQSNGFSEPVSGADAVFIFPQLANDSHSGTISDLAKYSENVTKVSFCSNQKVGDHLSVLGYPAVGGETLTVTDGIISGFETDNGYQFVKTSAKIDRGNSGGIAIEDSGCVLGIPTYIDADANGSIGRILDLGNLFQSSMPQ